MKNSLALLGAILVAAFLWLPAPSEAAPCSVAGHQAALFDLTDPILDLADATVRAEDAHAKLVQNADPGSENSSVVVDDLERLIDELFAAGSKLDRNNLEHFRDQEKAEREVMDLCIEDHYRAARVASSCADELQNYRRLIRSIVILVDDLIFAISNAEKVGAAITQNASTLWPTSQVRINVRNEDLDRMNKLVREARTIRSQVEREVRAERRPRRTLQDCIRQKPEYYQTSSREDRENSTSTPSARRNDIRSMQQALAECGFRPGPADGVWGDRTERAAAGFIRAHGGEPAHGNRERLAEQVASYLTSDAGPCPRPLEGQEAAGQSADGVTIAQEPSLETTVRWIANHINRHACADGKDGSPIVRYSAIASGSILNLTEISDSRIADRYCHENCIIEEKFEGNLRRLSEYYRDDEHDGSKQAGIYFANNIKASRVRTYADNPDVGFPLGPLKIGYMSVKFCGTNAQTNAAELHREVQRIYGLLEKAE